MYVQWEYMSTESITKLQEVGILGWELVSVTCCNQAERYHLKRPLPTLREQITLEQRADLNQQSMVEAEQ
ncbi:hypothetical protein MH117_07375 [Paenibacillus sp. ACRRX]|uniref:hypothetical protein n=1 Tax=unclassified Paenibacillus TaxID=185978 RepID=UPI001EF570B2|nr:MULTISPECIES: hypothetical protein [unclassified Paenibacillus]MCG7407235.1 hypothetical protein [Paenibacillus sp. ACRRX]MDK8180454.1 hypothetical protein [Paenibacillus sp. UMB4589-SE434]